MILKIYAASIMLLGPVISLYLWWRGRLGKEDTRRFSERRGIAGRARPAGELLWIHGASVGEALSILPLVDRLLAGRPEMHVLVTTGTVTSAELLAQRLPPRAIHQYVPIDHPRDVRRFLDHWNPQFAIWVESELWPNLISMTARREIPLFLIQGRLSEQSFRRWARFRGIARDLLGRFDMCLAQDEVTAERYRKLGARNICVAGNLKDSAPPLPVNQTERENLAAMLADRPRWIAASTHPGEEEIIAEALVILRKSHPELLTIIAPRHPARGNDVGNIFRSRGFTIARRSAAMPINAGDVFIVDTIGELGLFYRLAEIAFVGGSLIRHGGQNPMEAARLGCAILHGPHMTNFEAMATALRDATASVEVADAPEIARQVSLLLTDHQRRGELAARAEVVAAQGGAALDRVYELLAAGIDGDSARIKPHIAQHARA
ncbi:MAG: 3-deoxy-D-manno-octulosonic acid transferase [Proteobacteria bacterium]|nr:3-deoxy-D-manno-octulosonic acid transferase [Pseudomonadota bacterium]